MNNFDVIIVGGGPSGLRCAQVLKDSDKTVLLLEKDKIFGNKVCAGGLTRKDLAIIDLPDEVIEHKVTNTAVFSRKRQSGANAAAPFIFTVDRKTLGAWQRDQLKKSHVQLRSGAKVVEIRKESVLTEDGNEYGFKYLVGADGYNSIVRKHLGLPLEKVLIGIQYTIPMNDFNPRLEIHMHSKYFKAWYGWSFPHENRIAVGAVCDPKLMSSKKLKENFHKWLDEKGFDISSAKYESAPISYDYRGFQFDNIFLAGEAGGFASGFTGEGIYQCLVAGDTAARMILDPDYEPKELNAVLKYNSIQNKIMRFLFYAGPFRGMLQGMIVMLLNNKRIKAKINNSFS